VQRYLHRIDANLARMHTMLGNLTAVLAILDGAGPEPPEAVDLAVAIREALARAQAQLVEKGLVARSELDSPLPLASAHAPAVALLLDNLLSHAAGRSPQGGDITVRAERRSEAGGQEALVVAVHDRGQPLGGLAAGVDDIDATGQRPVALTVVRLLAERLGGRAWVEAAGQGAGFFIRLPVRRGDA
jgi:signal transduction histidine kinase